MSDKLWCPYCSKEIDPDLYGMYDEDELYETECPHCDKRVGIKVHQSFWYEEQAVPCWNGEPHDFSPWHSHHPTDDFTKIFETRYCYECGKREQETHEVTDSENHQRIIKIYKEV